MDDFSVVLRLVAGCLNIGLALVLHVKVSSFHLLDLCELLVDLLEHLSQIIDWIVSVLLENLLNLRKVWRTLIELEIGRHVVVQHHLILFQFIFFDLRIDLLGFPDSILQLQIVGQLELELWGGLLVVLVEAHVYEVLICRSEVHI